MEMSLIRTGLKTTKDIQISFQRVFIVRNIKNPAFSVWLGILRVSMSSIYRGHEWLG